MLTIKEIIRTLYNALVQKLKNHRGNWEQNDPTADDYIKNRPFYTDENDVMDIIPYQPLSNGTESYGMITLPLTSITPFVAGNTYEVTWDDKKYSCKAKNVDSIPVIGNSDYIDGNDTGEPFLIAIDNMFGGAGIVNYDSKEHKVGVTCTKIVTLDAKYIPTSDLGLAPVAYSGNYYDLYGTPTIYSDVVRYGSSQGLTAAQKKTAKTNIGAVGYDSNQNLTTANKTQARTNIGAVGYETQTLTNTQKQTARNNIGASDFSGSYNDLTDKPTNLATKAEIPDVSKFVEKSHLTDYSISGGFNRIDCGTYGSNKYFLSLNNNLIQFFPMGNVSNANQLQGYVEVRGENNNGLMNLSFFSNHMDGDGAIFSGKPRLVNIETPIYNYDAANKIYVDTAVANLVDSAPDTLNTLGELAAALQENQTVVDAVNSAVTNKVDKVEGKGLSTNDYTDEDKEKLANLNASKDSIALIDQVNGYTYILCMREGNLVTYCAAESVEVTTMPDKTEYVDGDQFDTTGMVMSVVAQDGSNREVSGYKWSPEVLTTDTTVVTVSYTEGNDTYTIEVPVTVKSKADVLVDFTYTDNGDGTYTITDWKGTYNGEPSTEIIIPDYSWIKV